jgi:hypothetical protein
MRKEKTMFLIKKEIVKRNERENIRNYHLERWYTAAHFLLSIRVSLLLASFPLRVRDIRRIEEKGWGFSSTRYFSQEVRRIRDLGIFWLFFKGKMRSV